MATAEMTMTDGGIETVLVFHDGLDLPDFAAFPLLYHTDGRAAMRRYYEGFLELSDEQNLPFVIDTPTWRANPDWGARLGYSPDQLAAANADAVTFVREVAAGRPSVLIEGMLGPRGDGYVVTDRMTPDEASAYHSIQISALRDAGVDRIAVLTLTYPEEAIGVVGAATSVGLPVVISFTVETDGRLPDGTRLDEAIEQVDAATGAAAEFFMINCAYPTHIAKGLQIGAATARIGGLRVNASRKSHAELDEAEDLDAGDPTELGRDTATLRELLPQIELLGGCCGTDVSHVKEILTAW